MSTAGSAPDPARGGRWNPELARRPRGQAREAVVAAAGERFARCGFAATAMAEVAADARVGKGTIYQHFPAKEDLLLECCLRHLAQAQSRVEAAAGGGAAESDPAAALRRVLEEALVAAAGGDGAQQRLFHDLWLALAGRPEQLADARARLRELYASWEGVVAFVVSAGTARGAFRRLPAGTQVPRLVTALVDGFAWQRAFRHDGDVVQVARDQAALFVAMLAA